jgi:hypothetical protein
VKNGVNFNMRIRVDYSAIVAFESIKLQRALCTLFVHNTISMKGVTVEQDDVGADS